MKASLQRLEDVREVFHLVSSCLDHWSDPQKWKSLLMTGVQRILESGTAMLQTMSPGPSPDQPRIVPIAWQNSDDPAFRDAYRYYVDSLTSASRPPMPFVDATLAPVLERGSMAFSRTMVVPDEAWYASNFFREYMRPAGVDEFAMSLRLAPQLGSLVAIAGNRPLGAPRVGDSAITLLAVLGEEIVPLLGTRLALDHQISRDGLSPRERETLDCLLEGQSEKEVAATLGIRPSTVHDYVVQLHRHFDVQSRGELLAYFVQRRPKERETNLG